MTINVNWWEIGDNQNLHLSSKEINELAEKVREKCGNFARFSKEARIGVGSIYAKLKYQNQGITVCQLKRVLDTLRINHSKMGKKEIKIGNYKFARLKFPFELEPVIGQLLAHSFFDGYCDNHTLRYSNYDQEIRQEFVKSVSKFVKIQLNIPENFLQDIDAPVFLSRFLKNYFEVQSFKSPECRIPRIFFEIVKENNDFGWFFLKGAYLDEGTISGKQLWVVRGIKNHPLARDILKLNSILGINSEIKESKKGYFSVKIKSESYFLFCNRISSKIFTKVNKWQGVKDKVRKFEEKQRIQEKVKLDCKTLIKLAKEDRKLITSEVAERFGITDSTAFSRLNLLKYLGNFKTRKAGRHIEYYLVSERLPQKICLNDMRRYYNWRQ